jgi:pimeloyl-ACP methyl ester carboxylesterase
MRRVVRTIGVAPSTVERTLTYPAGGDYADYERLSAIDASFLGIEDGTCHMHVGAVMLFDAAPLRTSTGGIDIDRIRRAVHARLHLVPRFRQRVAYVPWEGVPIWIDDDRFRLAYHVRHTALPQPGNDRVLKRLGGGDPPSRALPASRLVTMPGVGHLPMIEAADYRAFRASLRTDVLVERHAG